MQRAAIHRQPTRKGSARRPSFARSGASSWSSSDIRAKIYWVPRDGGRYPAPPVAHPRHRREDRDARWLRRRLTERTARAGAPRAPSGEHNRQSASSHSRSVLSVRQIGARESPSEAFGRLSRSAGYRGRPRCACAASRGLGGGTRSGTAMTRFRSWRCILVHRRKSSVRNPCRDLQSDVCRRRSISA
jgi:hypothetical protein